MRVSLLCWLYSFGYHNAQREQLVSQLVLLTMTLRILIQLVCIWHIQYEFTITLIGFHPPKNIIILTI